MTTSQLLQTAYREKDGKLFIDKDPDASLDYGFDLNDWVNNGDSINSAIISESVGVSASSVTVESNVCTSRISGGEVGADASVTFQFTTAAGLVDERTIHFNIINR